MKKYKLGSICHDPKFFEIEHQQAITIQEQSIGTTLTIYKGL